ncbi:M13-type metalloendopeptidase [Sphingomonas colocasiae]|uniref:M13 family metallopeptidase n=1 Tax=Sphingomonas colocasiae TaxID=1848973 RepID=A0ABS7PV51_9SPHN|nr:M13 family metallopeptidase [Sphingomonas colocasiae]MBY8825031.1 M13 family metallopeptidase [Sphingomonas colocasiae]
MMKAGLSTRRDAIIGLGAFSAGLACVPGPAWAGGSGDGIAPGDDFYRHINAAEIDAMTIPPGKWDLGQFDLVSMRVAGQMEALVRVAAARRGAPRSDEEGRVVAAWRALLDEGAIAGRGAAALAERLAPIFAAGTHDAIALRMADPCQPSPFAFNVFPAQGEWLAHLDTQNHEQPFLGLPVTAYAADDARSIAMRAAYAEGIAALLGLAGIADGARRAADILAIETGLAARQWPLERLRDRRANLHVMTVAELEAFAPGLPWRAMLRVRGLEGISRVNLGTDGAVAAMARFFAETPVEGWRSWLALGRIRDGAAVLPSPLRAAVHRLSLIPSGRDAPPPARAAEAIRFLTRRMPMDLGRLYVEAHVGARTRSETAAMLSYLKRAMAERLRAADWLDAGSKAEALAKLDAMGLKAAYPRSWPAWHGPALSADDAAGNLDTLSRRNWALQRTRLAGDGGELWYQAPQFVNASYSVLLNSIEVPAAILQPPFFSADRHPAANFGAIGAIVGHEIGHGFDDQGLLYDSLGVLCDWMSTAARAAFAERAERLVSQYEGFEPLPGLKLNGRRTLGENIADLSGVSLALRAWQLYRADHPGSAPDERTALRAFFASWAKCWCYKAPDDAIRHIVANSYHAPAACRVNGVVRNLDGWYDAFAIGPGEALYLPPDERVRLW